MPRRASDLEWSLTLFTMTMQLACGLAMAATLLDLGMRRSASEPVRYLGVAVFPLVAIGVLLSLVHLGHPFAAWKSFLNFERSRLSLEIVVTTIFALSSLFYSALWLMGIARFRLALGTGTVLLGLATVLASAAIYTVRTQPFWNSGWLPMSFLGTTLLFAGLVPTTFRGLLPDDTSARPFLGATMVGGLSLLVSAIWMFRRFCRLGQGRLASAHLQGERPVLSPWSIVPFGFYVLLTGILPSAIALALWSTANDWANLLFARFSLPTFVLISLGAVVGRALTYLAGTSLSRF